MLDTYQPEPFDGGARFKRFCQTVNETPVAMPKAFPVLEVSTVVPRTGLFDIYKRTTDLSVNKCVGIGFTYSDAVEFIKTRLKTKVSYSENNVIFYDIVEQENEQAKNPLWNPPGITKEGGTHTNEHSSIKWGN